MLEMFRRCEFSADSWRIIRRECDRQRIMFLSTPQNYSDLQLLLRLDIPAVKVGSDDFTNLPLLRRYAEAGLPMLLSCGMADLGEIYRSLTCVRAFERRDIALLLCTSQYPTPPEDVNADRLRTLRNAFPDLTLGFSDHTQGCLAAVVAVALGARIFEKNFTLDNQLPGPDHWFSENPASLKAWCDSIQKAFVLCGSARVEPTAAERDMRRVMRRSIYVTAPICADERIVAEKFGMFRPGDGLSPADLDTVIGMTARHDLRRGHLLAWRDLQ